MKTITKYQVVNSRIATMDNETELREFAIKLGHTDPEIITVLVNVLEEGDKITVSKHVGGTEDEDGITTGGKWIDITGTFHPLNDVVGEFRVNEQFFGMMRAEMGMNIYPIKDVRMV